MIPRTTPPFERIKWPAVRAISLTSAILPTRTCDMLDFFFFWGGEGRRGGGVLRTTAIISYNILRGY